MDDVLMDNDVITCDFRTVLGMKTIYFCLLFLLVGGFPNDQQLTPSQLTSFTACAPQSQFFHIGIWQYKYGSEQEHEKISSLKEERFFQLICKKGGC